MRDVEKKITIKLLGNLLQLFGKDPKTQCN